VSLAALLALAAATAGSFERGPAGVRGAVQRSPHAGLSSLPLAARGPVSAAVGADDPAYLIRGRASLSARNPAQHARISFSRSGVRVSTGGWLLSLALVGAGYGRSLRVPANAAPRASANRVQYGRGAVSEWYVNGPLGLEQGLTIARPPAPSGPGPLTLSIALGGDLRPALARSGRELVFRTADNRAVLRYGGLAATDARGHALRARMAVRGASLWLSVDARGARYPLRIDPFIQSAELTASDGADGDGLGDSVAISGSTVAVGAPGHTVAGHAGQGAVYVFSRPASGWKNATQTAELTASNGAAGDGLGSAVGFSGSTIVAGAPGAHAVVGQGGRGAVYVFSQPASGWKYAAQTAELSASDGAAGDELGYSVSISGTTVAAGAPEHSVASHGGQGAVYVFSRPASGWKNAAQTAELTASDGAASDELGYSVAIDGSTIGAGAGGHAVAGHGNQGAVYVFSQPASGWKSATQTAELIASDGVADDRLGDAVAVSGATIAGGSVLHAVGANSGQGAVYVFSRPASGWKSGFQTAELTASDGAPGDGLGYSIGVSGATLAAGAYSHAVGGANDRGAVYVFSQPASGWKNATQSAELTASDGAASDELGFSAAIDGETIVAGAPQHLTGAAGRPGAAYVFAGPQPPPPPAAPVVKGVRQSHDVWRRGNELATFARVRAPKIPVGTTFSFILGQAARVSFNFTQEPAGRKVGKHCVAPAARNRRRPNCTRSVNAGILVFTGHAGTNQVFFEGVLSRRKKLRPGRYTLIIVASIAGRRSRPQRLSFAIVR
jgi:trimeric autotransporter adhesin